MTNATCTAETHADLKSDVHVFAAHTRDPQAWAGLLTAQCNECGSTLALSLCGICGEPCAETDALPFGPVEEDRRVHVACVARGMIDAGVNRMCVLVGGGRAGDIVKAGGLL